MHIDIYFMDHMDNKHISWQLLPPLHQ